MWNLPRGLRLPKLELIPAGMYSTGGAHRNANNEIVCAASKPNCYGYVPGGIFTRDGCGAMRAQITGLESDLIKDCANHYAGWNNDVGLIAGGFFRLTIVVPRIVISAGLTL